MRLRATRRAARGPYPTAILGPTRAAALATATAETLTYIAAIETADNSQLEPAIIEAIVPFSNWRIPLGGACCILSGARTLAGMLVPMVGPAPTGISLVAGDYNRRRILFNGSTKCLNLNYNNNTLGQNDRHLYLWLHSTYTTPAATKGLIGGANTSADSYVNHTNTNGYRYRVSSTGTTDFTGTFSSVSPGGVGAFRSGASALTLVLQGNQQAATNASTTPISSAWFLGAANTSSAFAAISPALYSVGPHVSPTTMESNVSTLISALATALNSLVP